MGLPVLTPHISGVYSTATLGYVTIHINDGIVLTGVSAIGQVGTVQIRGWTSIDDAQIPNWGNVNTNQNAGWTDVITVQGSTWTKIDT